MWLSTVGKTLSGKASKQSSEIVSYARAVRPATQTDETWETEALDRDLQETCSSGNCKSWWLLKVVDTIGFCFIIPPLNFDRFIWCSNYYISLSND
jgi:hypothetical protein